MTTDYRNQNLQGRSFAGQTLEDVDFSGADLRGADFSGARLRNVNFQGAKFGRTFNDQMLMLGLGLGYGGASGLLCAIWVFLLFAFVQWSSFGDKKTVLETMLGLLLYFLVVMYFGLQPQRRYRTGLPLIGALLITGTIASYILKAAFGPIVGAGVLVVAGTLIVVVIISSALFGAGAMSVTVEGTLFFAAFSASKVITHTTDTLAEVKVEAIAGVTAVLALFSLYLGHRALMREENMLAYIRNFAVDIQSPYSTCFAQTELQQVDFSDVDLRGVSFVHARFQGCRFDGARNHHLALTTHSPLAPRAVRRLVIERLREETNFHAQDLSGLDFSGLDLRGYNFSHANLSFANFSGCDLREADLSAVTAVGGDFSGAKLTGACLENWNIDTETRLQDVNCDYYFYLDDGQRKRMPPAGEDYPPGEFSRIFQKLANTIDFIAHNEIELAAIQLAVEKVRVESDNEQVRVQSVEEKDGCIVVRVVAPKNEDRGALYHEVSVVKQEYENRILLLQAEKQAEIGGLLRNINDIKEQLREQRQDFLAEIRSQKTVQIGQVSEVNMGNKINIQGNVQNSGVMNLGGTVGGDMTQTPASSPDLQAALQTLHALIATLPARDQAEARQAAAELVQAEKQPPEEQQSTVRKTLRYFKGLATDLRDLGDLPDTATKLAEVAAKIALAFGLA